jgi:hypothetical protein
MAEQRDLAANRAAAINTVRLGGEGGSLFMAADAHLSVDDLTGTGVRLALNTGPATGHKPLRYFLRFPQEGQALERIKRGLQNPGASWRQPGSIGMVRNPSRARFPGVFRGLTRTSWWRARAI